MLASPPILCHLADSSSPAQKTQTNEEKTQIIANLGTFINVISPVLLGREQQTAELCFAPSQQAQLGPPATDGPAPAPEPRRWCPV